MLFGEVIIDADDPGVCWLTVDVTIDGHKSVFRRRLNDPFDLTEFGQKFQDICDGVKVLMSKRR